MDAFSWLDNYHKVEVSYEGIDWLTIPTDNGTINSNSSSLIPVYFDAMGMLGGDYYSVLDVETNDSLQSLFTVPVHLTVIGTPVIGLSDTALDFGGVF